MQNRHEIFVDAWLDTRIEGASAHTHVLLLRSALRTIWRRAAASLGEITVGAIFHRVFQTIRATYPLVEQIRLAEAIGAFEIDEAELARSSDVTTLRAVTRDLVLELLRVLGRLSGETLSAGLHAALSDVPPRPSTGNAHSTSDGMQR